MFSSVYFEGNQHSGAPPVEGVGGGGTSYGWSDGGCQLPASFSGVIDPSRIPSSDLVHVWHMPSTENVGNQGIPQQFEHVSCSLFSIYTNMILVLIPYVY